VELTQAQKQAGRDLAHVARLASTVAQQLLTAETRADMAAALLGLIGQFATARDGAAELYVDVTDSGGEG
jgi:hypothetical protein